MNKPDMKNTSGLIIKLRRINNRNSKLCVNHIEKIYHWLYNNNHFK